MPLIGWSSPLLDPADPTWLGIDGRLAVAGNPAGVERLLADLAVALLDAWPSVTYLGPKLMSVDGLQAFHMRASPGRQAIIHAIGRPGPTVLDARVLDDPDDLLAWCRRIQEAPVLVGGVGDLAQATHVAMVHARRDHWEATFRDGDTSAVALCPWSPRPTPTLTRSLDEALHRSRGLGR